MGMWSCKLANVDPFIANIPQKFLEDPDTREWFIYLNRFLHDLWARTGGGVDLIEDGSDGSTAIAADDNGLAVVSGAVDRLSSEVDALKSDSPMIHPIQDRTYTKRVVGGFYTINDLELVTATKGATLTFPKYPKPESYIITRNGDGSLIKLLGNGKTMNGSTTGFLRRKNRSVVWQYLLDTDEWAAI